MGHARGTVCQDKSRMAGSGAYARVVSYVGSFVLDRDSNRYAWSAVLVDFSNPRALPRRNDRRHPVVDHHGRVSRRRFASPHPDARSATTRQCRIDRRKFGSAATAVNQASCILRCSKNPATRARAFSALQAALHAASSGMRRLLLARALCATSPPLSLVALFPLLWIESDTGPPGGLVTTTPVAPHAPRAVAVAPHEGWMVAVAVG